MAFDFCASVFSDLKRIGCSVGGDVMVNDVLLALIAGGLRCWMEAHGRPPMSLGAQVPVSLHDGDQLANRDSFFCVELPLWEADPAGRLRLIREGTSIRKTEHDAEPSMPYSAAAHERRSHSSGTSPGGQMILALRRSAF